MVPRRLAAFPLILVASPAYVERKGLPVRPMDLAGQELIDLRRGLGDTTWRLLETDAGGADGKASWGGSIDVPVSPFLAVLGPGLLRDLALRGLGIAVLPSRYVDEDLTEGRLVHVLPGLTRGAPPIHAVFASRRVLAPKIRALLNFLAEIVHGRPHHSTPWTAPRSVSWRSSARGTSG